NASTAATPTASAPAARPTSLIRLVRSLCSSTRAPRSIAAAPSPIMGQSAPLLLTVSLLAPGCQRVDLRPDFLRDGGPHRASLLVSGPEGDPAVQPRCAPVAGRVGERRHPELDVLRGTLLARELSGFHHRDVAEAVAAGGELQQPGASAAERAVPGNMLGRRA